MKFIERNTCLVFVAVVIFCAIVGCKRESAKGYTYQFLGSANSWCDVTVDETAQGDGTTDDTQDIQDCINTVAAAGGGVVYIPTGKYKVTGTLTVDDPYTRILGAGRYGTLMEFYPTADDVLWHFTDNDSAGSLATTGISNMLLSASTDTTYEKTAILLEDVVQFNLRDVVVTNWSGDGSIGMNIHGRDSISIDGLYAKADRPLIFTTNAGGSETYGVDQTNFRNTYLVQDAGSHPVIEATGIVTDVSFTGFQAWAGGTHGFKWSGGTTTDSRLSLHNVRYEQAEGTAGYGIYIDHPLRFFDCQGCGLATEVNGIYLRDVRKARLSQIRYTGTGVGINIADGYELEIDGAKWGTSTTFSMGGYERFMGFGKHESSSDPADGHEFWVDPNTYETGISIGDLRTHRKSFTLANEARHSLPGDDFSGDMFKADIVCDDSGTIEGGTVAHVNGATRVVLSATSNFQSTNALNKLVYWEETNGNVQLWNRLGSSIDCIVDVSWVK